MADVFKGLGRVLPTYV
jgi:hypothetical protein